MKIGPRANGCTLLYSTFFFFFFFLESVLYSAYLLLTNTSTEKGRLVAVFFFGQAIY